MPDRRSIPTLVVLLVVLAVAIAFAAIQHQRGDTRFVSLIVSKVSTVGLYWKSDSGQIFGNIGSLKTFLDGKGKRLRFAMNGGMYMENQAPLGLFIERESVVRPLNTAAGEGNFYLQPNGVFYITNTNRAFIRRTKDFVDNGNIRWATQSGPMLVIDGNIHPAFRKGSSNVQIRNGVGILPGNKLLFAISKQPVNFHDFAEYFRAHGCRNALYLDGYVSRMYAPEKKWEQLDGDFGVIIGVVE